MIKLCKFLLVVCIATNLILILHACQSCEKWWKKYPHDNVIEEAAEEVIKSETGLDIDLTPSSPEEWVEDNHPSAH
jgi:hypothetical protein